jgi:5'-nucleotidase
MKRLKVLVDVDSTLNLFRPHFIAAVKAAGYSFDTAGFQSHGTWETQDFIEGAENPKKAMSEVMGDVNMWATVPPLPNAAKVLKDINRFHDVTIATVPWGTSIEMKKVKLDWLAKHFPFIRPTQVSFHPDKWELAGDVIFDDKPETIVECNKSMITVVPEQPYNRDVESDFRFTNWAQVPKIMGTIMRFYNKEL